jgi:P pilus assembly chaperone PapD
MKTLLLFILISIFTTDVFANLMVTPTRVAFDKRDRTSDVTLLNTSNTTRSYRVEWMNQAQAPDGSYIPLDESQLAEFPRADSYIRYSPRRVTLKPGESQTVKLMVRRKPDMDKAEYRSHLKFTALPLQEESNLERTGPAEGINIKLNVLLSYTIPILIRTEEADIDVQIGDLDLVKRQEDGKDILNFVMKKNSDTSVYGDFTVVYTANGKQDDVGYLNGVSMFAESDTLASNVVLFKPVDHSTGSLSIIYKGKQEFADTVFDEAELVLN